MSGVPAVSAMSRRSEPELTTRTESDEEERLIMQGGAGIPIGPVSSFLRSCRRYIIRRLWVAGWCSKTITTPSIT